MRPGPGVPANGGSFWERRCLALDSEHAECPCTVHFQMANLCHMSFTSIKEEMGKMGAVLRGGTLEAARQVGSDLTHLPSPAETRPPWPGRPAVRGCGPRSSSSWAPCWDCPPGSGRHWAIA